MKILIDVKTLKPISRKDAFAAFRESYEGAHEQPAANLSEDHFAMFFKWWLEMCIDLDELEIHETDLSAASAGFVEAFAFDQCELYQSRSK